MGELWVFSDSEGLSEGPFDMHKRKNAQNKLKKPILGVCMWSGAESNRRHMDFQSIALPTELPDRAVVKIEMPYNHSIGK